MEIPIQLKFFKKIELYREIVFEDHKQADSGTPLQSWTIEKLILGWTRLHHHHLGSPLEAERIRTDILKGKYTHEHQHAMSNLAQRGYATLYPVDTDPIRPAGIRITKEGLLVGEVIHDVESGNYFKYSFYYWLVWVTVVAGVIVVISNALRVVWPLIKTHFCER